VSRAGCFTTGWETRLRVSKTVKRVCKESRLNTKALLELLRKHDKRLPHLLPVDTRVQTSLEWAGSRDTLVATTICHPQTGDALTLVQFSWEGQGH
jgi:hypothetical protein